MSGVSQPTVADHRAHAALLGRLAGLGFVLPGTLTERRMRCGSPGCHCHDEPPALHGPYQQWTRTEHGKTVTRLIAPESVQRYRAWVADERVLQETIARLHELSISIVERDRQGRRNKSD